MKMIKVRVGEQNEINRRQIFNLKTGALDPLQKKKPVRKIRINQHVQIRELDEKRRVADPGDGDFTVFQLGKNWALMFAVARREQGFPDQLAKKGGGVEMLGRRQIL